LSATRGREEQRRGETGNADMSYFHMTHDVEQCLFPLLAVSFVGVVLIQTKPSREEECQRQ
jgi:hypothetical protein